MFAWRNLSYQADALDHELDTLFRSSLRRLGNEAAPEELAHPDALWADLRDQIEASRLAAPRVTQQQSRAAHTGGLLANPFAGLTLRPLALLDRACEV